MENSSSHFNFFSIMHLAFTQRKMRLDFLLARLLLKDGCFLNALILFGKNTSASKLSNFFLTFSRNSSYVTAVVDNSCLDWSARYQEKLTPVDHQFVAPFCLDESHPLVNPHSNFRGPFSIRRYCQFYHD